MNLTTKVMLEITPSADPNIWTLIPVQGDLGDVVIEMPDGSIVEWHPGDTNAVVTNHKASFNIKLLDATLVGLFSAVNIRR